MRSSGFPAGQGLADSCVLKSPCSSSHNYNTTNTCPRLFYAISVFTLYRALKSVNIGRRHKPHRQQLKPSKPWRSKGKRGKMGQESSSPVVDESTPTQTLESRTLESVAKMLKEGKFRRIVVMVSMQHLVELQLLKRASLTYWRPAQA